MAIVLLEVCEWHAGKRIDQSIREPVLSEVIAAVRALDGQARNDLYLRARGEAPTPWLCVGGGDGRYLVTGDEGGDSFPTLVDPQREGGAEVSLRVGGQIGSYPGHWVHSLEPTLRAVEFFWRTGTFGGPNLLWERR